MGKPRIFPHGDECNPYIMVADIIAYLTDSKLYIQKLKLEPPSLQKVWEPYGFQTETHFLDVSSVAKYRWYSDDPIDLTPYLARPLVFLLVDELEKLQPNPPPMEKREENCRRRFGASCGRETVCEVDKAHGALVCCYSLCVS